MLERVQAREIWTFAPTVRISTFSPVVMLNIRPVCRCCGGSGLAPVKPDPATLLFTFADIFDRTSFNTREVIRLARENEALRAALCGINARKLGRQLLQIEKSGASFDGVSIVRIGADRDGAIWSRHYSRV